LRSQGIGGAFNRRRTIPNEGIEGHATGRPKVLARAEAGNSGKT